MLSILYTLCITSNRGVHLAKGTRSWATVSSTCEVTTVPATADLRPCQLRGGTTTTRGSGDERV